MFYIRGLVAQLKKSQPRTRYIGQRSGGFRGSSPLVGWVVEGVPFSHPFTVTAHVRYSHPARFPRALVSGDSLQLSLKSSTWLVFTPSSSRRLSEYL